MASVPPITHAMASFTAAHTLCDRQVSSLPAGERCVVDESHEAASINCDECRACLRDRVLSIADYEPRSTLVVPEHRLTRARYPFVDVHSHQSAIRSDEALNQLVSEMDLLNMRVMVNLSGSYGSTLRSRIQNLEGRYPSRFLTFANIDFSDVDSPDYSRRAADQLTEDVRNGARGLKIFKNLGMDLVDRQRRRIHVDDPRFDPVFEVCSAAHIPVLIHSAEPKPFFDPVDRYNERWLELTMFPARARSPVHYPPWRTILDEQHRLFAKHPSVLFINAHLGWLGGDLEELGRLMDALPNMYTEIGAVLAELGRQPRQARKWMIRYQDRVLFGKDHWNPEEYHTYFRVLETDDEYFDYFRKMHGSWKLYGLELPDEVLRKLYYENALRMLPGIHSALFPRT